MCETDTASQIWEVKYTHSDEENILIGDYSSVVFALHARIMFNVKYSQNTQQNVWVNIPQSSIQNILCHLNWVFLCYMQNNSTWMFNFKFKVYTVEQHTTYALRAPPPFACPSNFVIMTEPTSTFSLKALDWASQAWPIVASITKIILSGLWNRDIQKVEQQYIQCYDNVSLLEVNAMI